MGICRFLSASMLKKRLYVRLLTKLNQKGALYSYAKHAAYKLLSKRLMKNREINMH
jgi:hypothetical protein